MNDTTTDPIAHAAREPNVTELIDEFRRCSPAGGAGWNNGAANDAVRFNEYPGKSSDGRKHGTENKEAFPFENASDAEIPLGDDICNDLTAEEFEAFWRAWLLPKFGTDEVSGYALKLADYFVTTELAETLYEQVELSSQYRNHYGWVALMPHWVREFSLENKRITMEDVAGLSENGGQQGQMLAAMIANPLMDAQAGEALNALYKLYVADLKARVPTFEAPDLSEAVQKRAVKELREKSVTEIPVPYICRDGPAVSALKPWDEVFITSDLVDVQRRRVHIRRYHDEVELEEKKLTGWSAAWVKEALNHKGKQSSWSSASPTASGVPMTIGEHDGTRGANWTSMDSKTGLVEVVYSLYRALDENGVPGVYMTVLCPHFGGEKDDKPGYAWHGLIAGARGKIPILIGKRENVAPAVCSSRSVLRIANTYQRQLKAQHDGLIDWMSMAVIPPLNMPVSAYGTTYKFGPGVKNTIQPGKEPKFMDMPTKALPVSIEMVQSLTSDARDYFGLVTERMPNGNASKKKKSIGSFLLLWTGAIMGTLAQAQAHMQDAEFARITGAPEGWLEKNRSNYGALGAKLEFDVRELNPEYALKQLDVMNKTVLPGDVTGSIPRDRWTQLQMRTVSPLWAAALRQDPKGASQQMYEAVRNDINSMFLGNEVQYVEMDPAAQVKLQYATQIVQANPTFQQALQQQGRFSELMKKYVLNLQFSLTQQDNKKIGAIGVKPESMGAGQQA